MIGVVPGPLMRSSLAMSERPPASSRKRSLVIASSAKTASRSSGAATRSNSPTGGKRLGTTRWLGRHRVRRACRRTCCARMSAVLTTAPGIEVLSHDVKVGDISRKHAFQRRLAAKDRGSVRLAHPGIRGRGVGKQNLQRLVNAENVRDPLQRVASDLSMTRLLPKKKSRTWRAAEERARFVAGELPFIGDAKEGAQGRTRQAIGLRRWLGGVRDGGADR